MSKLDMIRNTTQLLWITCLTLGVSLFSITLNSCAKRKKNEITTTMTKPMRPDGTMYSAYDYDNNWTLELDMNGQFSFKDFDKNINFNSAASDFQGFQTGEKQGLKWVMKDADSRELILSVIENQCHNALPFNKSFELEIKRNNTSIYTLSGCGSYHNAFGFDQEYQLSRINGEAFDNATKLDAAPKLNFSRVPSTNLIEGKIGCRSWRSQIDILNRTFVFNFDLAPNMDCIELEALTAFMEFIGNKPMHFSFSANNNTLTLSNKNDTFVFTKLK
jgi:heat shock protein HslJ